MIIYAVSDATGELAISIATAALRQFGQASVAVLRRAKARTPERVAKVVREARDSGGFIVFTLVSRELREYLLRIASEAQVPAIDIMGPIMDNLSTYFHKTPSDEPGLRYQIDTEYFKRNEAIEFAVKHDDGLGLETIDQAEIVIVGISRTSKTPLTMYLAYHGYKASNIPIIRDVPIPGALRLIDPKKLVGLTISPEKLAELRGKRLAKMGRPVSEDYANLDSIRQESSYAGRIFSDLGGCPVIDVTSKAIEEVASEVLTVLGK